jgi:glycosyltransferase involved in cell wall biosynthesis
VRLLLASDHYPPFIGGAQRQTKLLARRLSERGHEVALATPWQAGLPDVEEDGGVAVHRIRQLRTTMARLSGKAGAQQHQPPFPDPVSIRDLRRLLRSFEPELIQSYGWISYSVAVAMGRRRIPLLLTARDYGYFCANRTLVRKSMPCEGPGPLKCLACTGDYYGAPKGWVAAAGVGLSRRLLERKMTGLHSVSTYVEQVTSEHLDKPGLVKAVIPSLQDPELDAGGEPDLGSWLGRLPSQPFILFVGAFRRVKGLETLFGAYRQLDSPPPLVLLGTFERDSPEQFPEEATVLTNVPHAVVMAAWEKAMFGVMPSLWPEPLGATVAEAMSRGRPVIGTRLGGHADMLDETTGILVPQGDVEALASAMATLIADPERRERLGRAALRRSEDFSFEQLLPRLEATYKKVLAA